MSQTAESLSDQKCLTLAAEDLSGCSRVIPKHLYRHTATLYTAKIDRYRTVPHASVLYLTPTCHRGDGQLVIGRLPCFALSQRCALIEDFAAAG